MNREKIIEMVSKVAPFLFGFKSEDNYLIHDYGYKLLFYDGWNKTEIIGQGGKYNHRIGCSFQKDPRKIAADINRRLLPEYKKDFLSTKREKAKAEEYKTHQLSLLKALAHESGGEITKDYRGWKTGDHDLVASSESIQIRQHKDRYSLELSANFGEALCIVEFLKMSKII